MSINRDITSLLDIYNAAKKVLKFKGNLDKTAFLQDDKTQSAILYQLLIIGEAVKKSSKINFGFLANTFHTYSESESKLVSGRLLNDSL